GLRNVRDAALRYVTTRQAGEQVAIVAAGAPARVVSPFTTDTAALTAAISTLGANGPSARWDAVDLATGLVSNHPELQANLRVLSGAPDAASKASFDEVAG